MRRSRKWVALSATWPTLIAKNRTGGAVFMGGEHLPRPSEERAASDFIAELLSRGWRLPDGT